MDSAPRGFGGEGMSIIRERVQRLGGQLAVRRRLGGGTVLEVTLQGNPAERPLNVGISS